MAFENKPKNSTGLGWDEMKGGGGSLRAILFQAAPAIFYLFSMLKNKTDVSIVV